METTLTSYYESLHDLRTTFKSKLDEITQAYSSLRSIYINDEINEVATATATIIADAQIIANNYSDQVAIINSLIVEMADDNDEKANEEKQYLKERMESSDNVNNVPMAPVSLESLFSKTENRFNVALGVVLRRAKVFSLSESSVSASSLPVSLHLPESSLADHSPPVHSISPSPPTDATHQESSNQSSHTDNALIRKLSNSISQLVTQFSYRPNIALPPVKLETFDGTDISRWPAFKYQIDQLIINQPHLTEVEKAFHLRSSLKGVAYNLVASIPVHENFLDKIVSRLESQYGRHNLAQAKLIQSLRSIRSKSSQVTDQLAAVQSMINLAHSIHAECGVDSLCMQQIIAESINPRFITFVARNKPKTLLSALELIENELLTELEDALTISAYSSSHPVNFRENSDLTFPQSIQSLPFSTSPQFPNNTQWTHSAKESSHLINFRENSDSTFPELINSSSTPSSPTSKSPICVYCGEHSFSFQCTQVTSVKDRKAILTRNSLCHSCFSSKHATNDCNRSCPFCADKHHRSLCEKSSANRAAALTFTANPTQINNRLLTASVVVSDAEEFEMTRTRALLDPGAQISLISRKLASRLNLTPVDQLLMSVFGIKGANDIPDPPSVHDIVQFELVTTTGNHTIKEAVRDTGALVHPIHNDPLSQTDLAVIQSTLTSIPTHITDSVVTADLILGVGPTLKLLDDSKSTVLPSGFRLIQSVIGPMVAGSPDDHDKSTVSHDEASSRSRQFPTSSIPASSPPEDSTVHSQCNFTQINQPISHQINLRENSSFTFPELNQSLSHSRLTTAAESSQCKKSINQSIHQSNQSTVDHTRLPWRSRQLNHRLEPHSKNALLSDEIDEDPPWKSSRRLPPSEFEHNDGSPSSFDPH